MESRELRAQLQPEAEGLDEDAAPPASSPSGAAGTDRVCIGGHYEVVEELGRGGMARVYRVLDARSGATFALKQLLPQADAARSNESAALFEREFHTLAQLAHPRVIEVYDYGVDSAGPYYTMELLDGGDLRERSPLPWRDACELVFDVCSSLALLHSRRLVHRDVSPRNVRCTRDGHAKLIDFGAMVPMGANARLVGTPPFVAPEAVHNATLDARTDLFSLGNTLYFALTGRLAYPARSFAHLSETWAIKPPPPSAIAADVPAALDGLVMSLIGLEAALRPRSAFEVMQRLATVAGIERQEPLSVSKAYLTTPTLVARDEPLAKLREHLTRASRRRGRGVLLTAASGLGRSRMLDAFALEAKMTGACVLRAAVASASAEYLAVGKALADQLVGSAADVAASAAQSAGVWEELFEGPSEATDRAPVRKDFARGAAGRSALQAALVKWFLEASKQRLLVVIADDAENIDDGSIALIATLAQRARGHGLVVLASALQSADTALPSKLEVLRNWCSPLGLRPLELAETEQLLGSVFGDVPNLALLSARIHAVAAGNPREVMAITQHLVDRRVIEYDAGSWNLPARLMAADLPATAEDACRARVSQLSPRARSLVEIQALAGQEAFTRADYLSLDPGVDAATLDETLTALVTERVLSSDGHTYSLQDRTLTAVLSRELDEARRRTHHRALAQLYEQNQRHIFATARAWLLAGEPQRGVELILRFVRVVKDRIEFLESARIGIEEAGQMLAMALREAVALGRRPRDCHDLRQWLLMISVASDERTYWLAAPEWLAQLERDSGLADYRRLGEVEDAGQRLMRALTAAAERHKAAPEMERVYAPDEAIRFLVHYVVISIAIGARTLDAPLLMSLPEILEPFAPISPLVHAIWQNAVATRESSCLRRAERARLRWIEVYEKLGQLPAPDPNLVASIRYAIAFGVGLGEATMGRQSATEWADILDRDPLQRVSAMYLRKIARLQQGDLEGAEHCRKQAELLELEATVRQMFTNLLTVEVSVHAAAWDLTGVKQMARRIEAFAERHRGWLPFRHLAEAHYRRLRGDLPAALAAYERCLALATPDEREPTRSIIAWAPAAACYTETLIALDRAVEARAFATAALAEGKRREMVSAVHDLVRALALAEAKLGDHARAVVRLEGLIDEQRELGVTGLALGATYEARTRVAIWAADRAAVECYSKLTAEQYRHGHGSPLGVRYERLMEEARGAGVVVPSLSPFESTILGSTSTTSSRNTASATVISAMTGAGDRGERAERALQLLCDASRARGGHLYLVVNNELCLVASRGGHPPDDALQRMLTAFWTRQNDGVDAETAMLDSTDGLEPQMWTETAGEAYRPVFLNGRLNGRATPAGIALLCGEGPDPTDAATEMPLVTELASFLLRSGDSKQ